MIQILTRASPRPAYTIQDCAIDSFQRSIYRFGGPLRMKAYKMEIDYFVWWTDQLLALN